MSKSVHQTQDVEQLFLPLDVITVHCFFLCPFVAQSVDPGVAHDLMERHYTEKHDRQIKQILGVAQFGRKVVG